MSSASARDLRLQSDFENLSRIAKGSGGTLAIESAVGRPPDQYILAYHCRSIERLEAGRPIYRSLHRVEIRLPARYPAPIAPPRVRMLTPIWHPHVYTNSVVCMGEWQTTEYLDVFALRLGALLQFEKRYLDVRDPANEAAIDWARKNLLLFPTDTCSFAGDAPESERRHVRADSPPGAMDPFSPSPSPGAPAPLLESRQEGGQIIWRELK